MMHLVKIKEQTKYSRSQRKGHKPTQFVVGLNSKQLGRFNRCGRQTGFKAICGKELGRHTNQSNPSNCHERQTTRSSL